MYLIVAEFFSSTPELSKQKKALLARWHHQIFRQKFNMKFALFILSWLKQLLMLVPLLILHK